VGVVAGVVPNRVLYMSWCDLTTPYVSVNSSDPVNQPFATLSRRLLSEESREAEAVEKSSDVGDSEAENGHSMDSILSLPISKDRVHLLPFDPAHLIKQGPAKGKHLQKRLSPHAILRVKPKKDLLGDTNGAVDAPKEPSTSEKHRNLQYDDPYVTVLLMVDTRYSTLPGANVFGANGTYTNPNAIVANAINAVFGDVNAYQATFTPIVQLWCVALSFPVCYEYASLLSIRQLGGPTPTASTSRIPPLSLPAANTQPWGVYAFLFFLGLMLVYIANEVFKAYRKKNKMGSMAGKVQIHEDADANAKAAGH
jgi:hypothetical protein